jgi:hypothetical protein
MKLWTVFLALGLLTTTGCPVICSTETRASVVLAVVDKAKQEVVEKATIVWSVDGGPETTVTCETGGEAQDDECGGIALAYEVPGSFDIEVSAEGFETEELSVTVEEGKCHVESEAIIVEMVPD